MSKQTLTNDIVIVDVSEFLKATFSANPDSVLVDKLNTLFKTYACFRDQQSFTHFKPNESSNKWRVNNNTNTNNTNNKNSANINVRVRIGATSHSIESKEFISQLNKLSPKNSAIIIERLRLKLLSQAGIINTNSNTNSNKFDDTIYIRILWDFMQRQPGNQELYIMICKLLPKNNWQSIFNEYIEKQLWFPPHDLLIDNNIEYDEFCDYVKWKNRAVAASSAINRLIANGFIDSSVEYIIHTIISSINQQNERIIGDLVDQLNAYNHSNNILIEFCNNQLKNNNISSLTKFKLETLLDKIKYFRPNIALKNSKLT